LIIFDSMFLQLKRLFPLIIVGLVVFMTSCTREYICQCVVKYSGNPPGLPDTATHEFLIKDTKKEAAKKCEANSTSATQDNITMVETCRLY
jgi:hypothetical protein